MSISFPVMQEVEKRRSFKGSVCSLYQMLTLQHECSACIIKGMQHLCFKCAKH